MTQCVGVNVKVKRPIGCAASQLVVSRETGSASNEVRQPALMPGCATLVPARSPGDPANITAH